MIVLPKHGRTSIGLTRSIGECDQIVRIISACDIIFVRHTESVKNIHEAFATATGSEELTPLGVQEAHNIGRVLVSWMALRGTTTVGVYASNSRRAVATARAIGDVVGASVTEVEELASIGSGVLSGVSEKDAERLFPEYISALRLFRAGLFNSYAIPDFEGKEGKREFEIRVISAVERILARPGETLKVVCTQRSPITAALIDFARRFHGYPYNFWGHVQLDLGRMSWVHRVADEVWRIEAVNISPEELGTSGCYSL